MKTTVSVPAPEALPRDVLQKLVSDIYDAVGVRVSLTGCAGERLAETEYQNILCRAAERDPAMHARCLACTEEAARRAASRGGVFIYRCWRGLMSACAPILLDGQSPGRLVLSGFVSTPDSMAAAEQLFPDPDFQLSADELATFPFIYQTRVRDTMRIISIAASYITELYRRRRAEQLQAQAEFQALQSQISPHFLFNTLNSISQLALLEGAEQSPEAIYALAAILRRAMKQNTGLVTLEDELQTVREYVRLKQFTGRSPIEYREELEPGTEQLLLPAFTVQPMIENAIAHGLEPLPQGGLVTLTAHTGDGCVVLSVTDNGAGFDPDIVKPAVGGEMSGIGFANVVSRLRSFFGPDFRNEVYSAPGEGTTISLSIPRAKAGF